jgi:hypothetical protein
METVVPRGRHFGGKNAKGAKQISVGLGKSRAEFLPDL